MSTQGMPPASGHLPPPTDRHPPPLPDLEQLSFEELVELLESLARQMASGEVGIELAADLYEQAGEVHREATERLARVQARLEALAEDRDQAAPSC
jgi:exodeoxyribonuclease VII small subunit